MGESLAGQRMRAVMSREAERLNADLGSAGQRAPEAFPTLSSGTICPGCGRPFEPTRRNRRHCRPSCRVIAHERRQLEKRQAAFWDADASRFD